MRLAERGSNTELASQNSLEYKANSIDDNKDLFKDI